MSSSLPPDDRRVVTFRIVYPWRQTMTFVSFPTDDQFFEALGQWPREWCLERLKTKVLRFRVEEGPLAGNYDSAEDIRTRALFSYDLPFDAPRIMDISLVSKLSSVDKELPHVITQLRDAAKDLTDQVVANTKFPDPPSKAVAFEEEGPIVQAIGCTGPQPPSVWDELILAELDRASKMPLPDEEDWEDEELTIAARGVKGKDKEEGKEKDEGKEKEDVVPIQVKTEDKEVVPGARGQEKVCGAVEAAKKHWAITINAEGYLDQPAVTFRCFRFPSPSKFGEAMMDPRFRLTRELARDFFLGHILFEVDDGPYKGVYNSFGDLRTKVLFPEEVVDNSQQTLSIRFVAINTRAKGSTTTPMEPAVRTQQSAGELKDDDDFDSDLSATKFLDAESLPEDPVSTLRFDAKYPSVHSADRFVDDFPCAPGSYPCVERIYSKSPIGSDPVAGVAIVHNATISPVPCISSTSGARRIIATPTSAPPPKAMNTMMFTLEERRKVFGTGQWDKVPADLRHISAKPQTLVGKLDKRDRHSSTQEPNLVADALETSATEAQPVVNHISDFRVNEDLAKVPVTMTAAWSAILHPEVEWPSSEPVKSSSSYGISSDDDESGFVTSLSTALKASSAKATAAPGTADYLENLLLAGTNTTASSRLLRILRDEAVGLDTSLGLKLLDLAAALRTDGELAPNRVNISSPDPRDLEPIKNRLNDFAGMLNVIAEAVGVNLLEDEAETKADPPLPDIQNLRIRAQEVSEVVDDLPVPEEVSHTRRPANQSQLEAILDSAQQLAGPPVELTSPRLPNVSLQAPPQLPTCSSPSAQARPLTPMPPYIPEHGCETRTGSFERSPGPSPYERPPGLWQTHASFGAGYSHHPPPGTPYPYGSESYHQALLYPMTRPASHQWPNVLYPKEGPMTASGFAPYAANSARQFPSYVDGRPCEVHSHYNTPCLPQSTAQSTWPFESQRPMPPTCSPAYPGVIPGSSYPRYHPYNFGYANAQAHHSMKSTWDMRK